MKKTLATLLTTIPLFLFADWNINFDEKTSTLEAINGGVSIKGKLNFQAYRNGGNKWKIVNSRDGVKNRMAIIDNTGDVQGYIVFPKRLTNSRCFSTTALPKHIVD